MRDETFDKLRALALMMIAGLGFSCRGGGNRLACLVVGGRQLRPGCGAGVLGHSAGAGRGICRSSGYVSHDENGSGSVCGSPDGRRYGRDCPDRGVQRDLAKACHLGRDRIVITTDPFRPLHPILHPQYSRLSPLTGNHAQLATSESEWSDVT
jgi:hypothetical protein